MTTQNLDVRPKIFPITGGGFAFLHPCSVCGDPVAPFGYGVHLRSAKPGTWFCRDHRKGRPDAT